MSELDIYLEFSYDDGPASLIGPFPDEIDAIRYRDTKGSPEMRIRQIWLVSPVEVERFLIGH